MPQHHVDIVVRPPQEMARQVWLRNLAIEPTSLYSVLPKSSLVDIGIWPYKSLQLRLENGETAHREIALAFIEFGVSRGYCDIVLGEDIDRPILGSLTLDTLNLTMDLQDGRLVTGPVQVRGIGEARP